jgi:hypothetical protein
VVVEVATVTVEHDVCHGDPATALLGAARHRLQHGVRAHPR